jgi:hypothetical protein
MVDGLHRRGVKQLWVILGILWSTSAASGRAQPPIDLFSDVPRHAAGFVRLGSWNVRHLKVESSYAADLPGRTLEEDTTILWNTFADAILDLQLDLVVLIEVQPRSGEPNALLAIQERLRQETGDDWRSDITDLKYDDLSDPYGNLQFGLLWTRDQAGASSSMAHPSSD